jgi:hypothetical protein
VKRKRQCPLALATMSEERLLPIKIKGGKNKRKIKRKIKGESKRQIEGKILRNKSRETNQEKQIRGGETAGHNVDSLQKIGCVFVLLSIIHRL